MSPPPSLPPPLLFPPSFPLSFPVEDLLRSEDHPLTIKFRAAELDLLSTSLILNKSGHRRKRCIKKNKSTGQRTPKISRSKCIGSSASPLLILASRLGHELIPQVDRRGQAATIGRNEGIPTRLDSGSTTQDRGEEGLTG